MHANGASNQWNMQAGNDTKWECGHLCTLCIYACLQLCISTCLHSASLHSASLHSTSLHSTHLHSASLHICTLSINRAATSLILQNLLTLFRGHFNRKTSYPPVWSPVRPSVRSGYLLYYLRDRRLPKTAYPRRIIIFHEHAQAVDFRGTHPVDSSGI